MLFNRRKWFGLLAAAFTARKLPAAPAAHAHTCALCEDISGVQIMRRFRELQRKEAALAFSADNFRREITIVATDGTRRTVPINMPEFHREAFKLG